MAQPEMMHHTMATKADGDFLQRDSNETEFTKAQMAYFREKCEEAIRDPGPGMDAEIVLQRLHEKYVRLVEEHGS